ncbi:MAG: hypothetical protein GX146_09075 [Myxococcales bacterium]|jgi:formate dehydrogenase subunit delta|nr:hypothetical protein [Myxococcales bacterium]
MKTHGAQPLAAGEMTRANTGALGTPCATGAAHPAGTDDAHAGVIRAQLPRLGIKIFAIILGSYICIRVIIYGVRVVFGVVFGAGRDRADELGPQRLTLAATAICPHQTDAGAIRTQDPRIEIKAFSGLCQLVTGRFQLVTGRFQLVTGRFQLVTGRFQLVTGRFQLVTGLFCVIAFIHAGGLASLASLALCAALARISVRARIMELQHAHNQDRMPRYFGFPLRSPHLGKINTIETMIAAILSSRICLCAAFTANILAHNAYQKGF